MVVEVDAIVVAAPTVGAAPPLIYQLKVEGINNVSLAEPVTLNFSTDLDNPVYIAPSRYELEQLLQRLVEVGRHSPDGSGAVVPEPPISKEKADVIRQGFLGSRHRLIVYEAGRWHGAPKSFPENYGYLAPRGPFVLETFLVVIAEK
jgi:hypothetical protein